MSYSINELIDAIDEHPLRWEEITLESVISLPTLVMQDGQKIVEFFFYPIGGPIDDRKIWPPYYQVTGSASPPYNIEYQPISVDTDEPLGAHTGSLSPDEYDTQLQNLYTIGGNLIDIYPKALEEASDIERETVKEFKRLFDLLVDEPTLPAYHALNPQFFQWLTLFH